LYAVIPHGIFPYGLGFVGLGELRELFNVDRVVVASATQVSQGGSAASTRQHTYNRRRATKYDGFLL
jgi:hypothetical protein